MDAHYFLCYMKMIKECQLNRTSNGTLYSIVYTFSLFYVNGITIFLNYL